MASCRFSDKIRHWSGHDTRGGHAMDIQMTNYRYQPAVDVTFRHAYSVTAL